MGKINRLLIVAIFVLFNVGCGSEPSVKKEVKKEKEFTLYINLDVSDEGIALDGITDTVGDIDLRTLQVTSDEVKMKLCNSLTDEACIKEIIDLVASNVETKDILGAFETLLNANKAHEASLDAIRKVYQVPYEAGRDGLKLRYLIDDQSKMYKGEKLPMTELAFVGLHDLSYPETALHAQDIHDIFPHPVEDFVENVLQVNKDLQTSYTRDEKVYRRTIRSRTNSYPIVRRKPLKEGPFTLEVKALQSIPKGTVQRSRVIFRIVGKDLNGVYPFKFICENKDLKIIFTKRKVSFLNKGNKAISLKDITFSYNGKKKKTILGANFGFSKLSPEATTTTPTKVLLDDSFKEASRFLKMSKDKADARTVDFGISVHYTLGSSKKVKTLTVTRNLSLWRVISGW